MPDLSALPADTLMPHSRRREIERSRHRADFWTAAAVVGCLTLGLAILLGRPVRADEAGNRPTPGAAPVAAPTIKPTPPGVAAAPGSPVVKRPVPAPATNAADALTDDKIGEAIKKGVENLLKQFDPNTHMISEGVRTATDKDRSKDPSFAEGLDALCVYALLQSSLAINNSDPRIDPKGDPMRAMIMALEQFDFREGNCTTYAHGLRASVLSVFVNTLHLPDGPSGRTSPDTIAYKQADAAMRDDLAYSLWSCDGGAYSYEFKIPTNGKSEEGQIRNPHDLLLFYNSLNPQNPGSFPRPKGGWDNSNSQYGVLAAWSVADAGIGVEMPLSYWALVDHHWVTCQAGDGGWKYSEGEGDPTLSMSCAGLASEFVTHDYLEPVVLTAAPGRTPYSPAEKRGLDWFERGDHAISVQDNYGYTLYGVERVGLASGFKFFGSHDWYRVLALKTIAKQDANTGAIDDTVNTAYSLLFLARGRHPIVMSKLRFDTDGKKGTGFWNNRPRDASNLSRFIGKNLEKQFNWQVINVDTDWTGWMDSPLLEITAHKDVKFTPEQIDRLRNYSEAGGLIFLQADGDSPEFVKSAQAMGHQIFPQYEFAIVPNTHPLYTESIYKIPPRADLKMLTNGSRILVLFSPRDISKYWQTRDDQRHKVEFQFGANLYIYAAGKRDPRKRLDSIYVPPATSAPSLEIKVARLQYAGNWDPEPGAWRRFANLVQARTNYKVNVSTVKVADLKPGEVNVAVMTGIGRATFNAQETAALKAYVEAGGVLLMDMTGGNGTFDQGADALVRQAFPQSVPQSVSTTFPLLLPSGPGMLNLADYHLAATRDRKFRPAAVARGHSHGSELQFISAGKGHVLFTPLDITTGLLGTDTAGIIGYDSYFAESLTQNIILWTLDGQKEQ